MLDYNRIDVSKRIDINNYKKKRINRVWYFPPLVFPK